MRAPSSSSASTSKPTPCCAKVGIKKGPWTPEEDEVLSNYIKKEGEGKWRTLPKRAGLQRCGKSCRLRWMNYLRPNVKRGPIAPDEEDLILRLHRLLGNRWSLIAGRIPGRTDNEIKNYWNTHLSKKLISQGIDPRTHKPLNPSHISSVAAEQSSNNNNNFGRSSTFAPDPSTLASQQPYTHHNALALEETQVIFRHNGHEPMPLVNQQPYSTILCNENWQHLDGFMTGLHNNNIDVHQSYVIDHHNCNNDQDAAFATFLDTLIDDTYMSTPHPRPNITVPPLTPIVSAAANYGQAGVTWGAELIRSALETLDDNQQQFSNNLRHL